MVSNSARRDNDSIEKSRNRPPVPLARIETQIHRRTKAKASFPLEDEWKTGAAYPANLKMPAQHMDKHGHVG